MLEPTWSDPNLACGTMARAALWLRQEVGEGNIFKKQDLRSAFPGTEQIDRRMRDLRKFGWVLHTNQLDKTLGLDELRFVQSGVAVWIPEERRKTENQQKGLSNADRIAALAAHGYQCVWCGIAGGESYPDDPTETAVLTVTQGESHAGVVRTRVECRRCRAGGAYKTWSEKEIEQLVSELDEAELGRLRSWLRAGVRTPSPADRVWALIRWLPRSDQQGIVGSI